MMKKLIAHLVLSDETGCLAFTATGCDIFLQNQSLIEELKEKEDGTLFVCEMVDT